MADIDWPFLMRMEVAGGPLFSFLTMHSATRLRRLCTELRTAVAGHAWDDMTPIRGSLASWRASFPRARQANISHRRDLAGADFAHLAGIHKLDMEGCNQATITDAAFVHLAGIHTLCMSGCNQGTIMGATFRHLAGVNSLG